MPQGYNRYVTSYLVAEVLAQVPGDIQEFLIRPRFWIDSAAHCARP